MKDSPALAASVVAPVVFPPMRRQTVVEEFLNYFTQSLIEGKLQPGQRLPSEPELAQQIGVGRNAIREAIKMLAALGIVTVKKGSGTFIVDRASPGLLSPLVFAILLETGMSRDLLELRSLFEVGYCRLAAQHATEADWRRIDEAAAAWEALARSGGDVDELTRLDLAFHYAILEATHNALIIKLGHAVEEMFFASIRAVLSSTEGLAWGIEGHRKIVGAMREGDPERIRIAVDESLAYWGRELTQQGR